MNFAIAYNQILLTTMNRMHVVFFNCVNVVKNIIYSNRVVYNFKADPQGEEENVCCGGGCCEE